MVALSVSVALLAALTVWRLASGPADAVHEFTGYTMGTTFNVKVDADMSAEDHDLVHEVIEARLGEVDHLMSTYDSTSELSRFNRHLSTEPVVISGALLEVLTMAHDVSERSAGAFDVTVAPLVDAWGFGPEGRPSRIPDNPQLATLRERVGYQRIVLDRAAGTVSKTRPETVVDLSAIAKGYGVESIASGLLELRLTNFLVEVGGELKAMGARRDGGAWRVGIERPDASTHSVYGVVHLIDEAIATSGDYRNFYEEKGVRYAHIIDPRTGSPIRHRGTSVSVAAGNAAIADAWATALTVLGPDAGYDLAREEGIAALFVMHSNGDFRSRATPAFAERLGAFSEIRRP
jgi:thiamine biosynthesis lipoprotein